MIDAGKMVNRALFQKHSWHLCQRVHWQSAGCQLGSAKTHAYPRFNTEWRLPRLDPKAVLPHDDHHFGKQRRVPGAHEMIFRRLAPRRLRMTRL